MAQTSGQSAAPADSASQAPQVDQATPNNPAQSKSLTEKAIDKVKQVAKSAGDIFSRVPCLPPKGLARSLGSLPRVAHKLAAGQPVVIVAFGSSSTAGYGTSAPEFTYPNRLADQLRRKYPTADIAVVNRGRGGEDAPEMMKRLQTEVIDMKPDLVIWQVGTNAVLRNLDPGETAQMVQDGVGRIQSAGADVVLVDLQYSPRVIEHPEGATKMVKLLGRIAQLRHIGVFPRFEVMRAVAREPVAADRQLRHRRRAAHERLGLCLLRPVARRRYHPLGWSDQARRQRAVQRANQPADVSLAFSCSSSLRKQGPITTGGSQRTRLLILIRV